MPKIKMGPRNSKKKVIIEFAAASIIRSMRNSLVDHSGRVGRGIFSFRQTSTA